MLSKERKEWKQMTEDAVQNETQRYKDLYNYVVRKFRDYIPKSPLRVNQIRATGQKFPMLPEENIQK